MFNFLLFVFEEVVYHSMIYFITLFFISIVLNIIDKRMARGFRNRGIKIYISAIKFAIRFISKCIALLMNQLIILIKKAYPRVQAFAVLAIKTFNKNRTFIHQNQNTDTVVSDSFSNNAIKTSNSSTRTRTNKI